MCVFYFVPSQTLTFLHYHAPSHSTQNTALNSLPTRDMDVVNLMKSSSDHQMEIMTLLTMRRPDQRTPNPYTTCLSFSAGAGGYHQEPFPADPVKEEEEAALFPHHKSAANSMEAMREMIFGMAMMQPIHIDPESVRPPKRKNVKISKDPQSVAARQRRERISEKIRILQRLVPGGTKMDTASMLDEAVHYVKFLKKQLEYLEQAATAAVANPAMVSGFPPFHMNYSGSAIKSSPGIPSMGFNLQMMS
ncbi:unnamed protein product [Cuscuta europaea]|uniref:BHLH domain-containing protein n=1 Tax=Cuscuta europaea TaxID=41803 RepID=A0A9P0YN44_CUSEU|nr:unnamed protein product [Cuscuta europaea]